MSNITQETIQELNLELIRRASFNNFNGAKVAEDLLNNHNLWEGAIIDREGYSHSINLIKLRDISDNDWNVDTLFILPLRGQEQPLEELAANWNADELSWIDAETSNSLPGGDAWARRILRVWWD